MREYIRKEEVYEIGKRFGYPVQEAILDLPTVEIKTKEVKKMNDFFYFNDRIFNKNFITCAYVQFNAFSEEFTPVCEVSGSKSPINLNAPTENINDCKKVLQDFFTALKGENNGD